MKRSPSSGRPVSSRQGQTSVPKKGGFSFWKNLISGREERQKQNKEQAAKLITNNRAENENEIIDMLATINFVRSPIPPQILNHKTKESQTVGDLEYGSKAIQSMIRNSPNFSVDISEIDKRILELTLAFKNAVNVGNVKAAYAAKGALVTCISKVRNRIPSVNPKLVAAFIENSASYLDTWILLVEYSREVDEIENNINTQQSQYDANRAAFQAETDKMEQKIQSNNEYLEAFVDVADLTAEHDKSKWTKPMHEVHSLLVEQKIKKANHDLNLMLLEGNKLKLTTRESEIELLSGKVASLPIPIDPDAINKYKEEVDGVFKTLSEMDTEIDDALSFVEDIEGRIDSLNNAPGAVHLRNAEAQQAEEFMKNYQEKQNREVSPQGTNREKLLARFNIRSEEQQKEMIRQAEEQRQREMEKAVAGNQNTNWNEQANEEAQPNVIYEED